MPELDFQIVGVDSVERGLVPLLEFAVGIRNGTPSERIQSVMLQAQIHIQAPQRAYNASEKDKLHDLFGPPEDWGRTLSPRFLAHSNTIVRGFADRTQATLPVPCTFDLNVATAKYFYALEDGQVPLLFLFSGTYFYSAADGRLQIGQISWNSEASYQMQISVWREMMERHYPGRGLVSLDRDTFDLLYAFKRRHGFATWEQAIECLLAGGTPVDVAINAIDATAP
jgi:hypothetical protein